MRNSKQHRGLAASVLFAAMAQVLWPAPAAAQNLPAGLVSAVDQNGAFTPTVSTVGNTMTVTLNGPRSIYNWTSFDVAAGYAFTTTGGSSSSLMVNRVLGGTASSINGVVQSNANIWLLNPNGIAVGSTGSFDVGGLLLSTAGVTDADVLDGNLGFDFSGASTNAIVVQPGAALVTYGGTGGIYLLANSVDFAGSTASAGDNTLLGSRGMTVTFDSNLSAITTLDLGSGSTQAISVVVRPGASFSGTRTMLMAAGMNTSSGNVLLANPGGATDIHFGTNSVDLVSRDANVITQGVFTTPGDLTINAAQMFQGNGAPTVGGDYSITAQDFSGGVFSPTFVGTDNDFSITDTQGGLTVGGLTAPGNLSITAQGASLSTVGALSSTSGNLRLEASDAINLSGDLNATVGSVTLVAGSTIMQPAGVISTGTLDATAGATIALNDLNSWSAAGFNSGGGSVSAVSTGDWTLLDSSSAGALHVTGQTIGVNGMVLANGDLTLDGDVSVDGDTTMNSFTGAVTLAGDIDGAHALTVGSGTGTYFNGNIGASTALGSLTVNGASTFSGSTLRTAGAMDLDTFVANGAMDIDAGGSFTATTMYVPDAALAVDANGISIYGIISDAAVVSLDAGTGGIQLGTGTAYSFEFGGDGDLDVPGALNAEYLGGAMGGSATLDGDNHIYRLEAFSSNGFTLRTREYMVIEGFVDAGAGDVRIEAVNRPMAISSSGTLRGHDIVLSSSTFNNVSGANALLANGHWVVYLQAPSGNNYDGLDSANTALWGSTLATLAPSSVSGNRYVFAFTPTLTFTSIDTTKIYGTDLSSTIGSLFAVTGYQAGVAGAYLGDDAASAFSGAPLLTSAGADMHASVAGGPYAIGIANGSLASTSGYQFAFSGAGEITVDPKTLTGTATATNKTYDGTADGSGTISLDGIVAGDTVGADGTFTFSDANAGLGKTVTLTGVTLTGADAGNYTITIPATTLGDILQKALTGTATATTKTYDGSANGSGTITLSGVVAGDTVGAGGTFTFSDANAGTGKTVTLSGVTLTGADAGNYTLTIPATLLGDILQKAISGTVTVTTKTYDGSASGSGTVSLAGVVAGDDVSGSATFTFSDANAGNGKTVTVSGAALSGADAGNYTVTLPASALGDILRKALTGTAVVDTKTYDGTTSATGTVGLSGVVAGDDVSGSATFAFSDANAGTGKTVNVSGAALSGADAGNYTLTLPASVLADILQKALTGTATAATKTYDGTTTGSGTVALSGVVAGDDVSGSATFTFSDANAGTGKTVTVSGATLSGADAGNYTVTLPASVLADILQRAITVTADAATKEEGADDPALTWDITSGSLVAGDTLSGSLARAAGEAPGQYAIGQGTLDASANYTLTFVGSNLTITRVDTGPVDPDPVDPVDPVDPTDGVVVRDQVGAVIRFILGLQPATDTAATPLQVADQRDCDPGAPAGTCGSSRQ